MTDAGASLTITHTAADGTLLEGTRKGDGAWEAIKEAQAAYTIRGWRYFPSIRAIGLSHSRDRAPQLRLIERTATVLRDAGFTVDVQVETAPRAMEDAEAGRAARLDDRADALTAKAERKTAEADARFAAADQISDMIPMGQPILVGHHSERRHRRDLQRMHDNTHKGFDAMREARRAEHYAETSAKHMGHREAPHVTANRVERLEAEERKIQRTLTPCNLSGRKMKPEAEGRTVTCPACYIDFTIGAELLVPEHGAATGLHREELEARADYITEELRYWRGILEEARAAGQIDTVDVSAIRKGDAIRYGSRWYRVARVNKTTVSVETGYSWTDKVKHRDIVEHKPAESAVAPVEV